MSELENIGGTRKQLETDIRKRFNNSLATPDKDFSMFIDQALAETQIDTSKTDIPEPKKEKPQLINQEEQPEIIPRKKTLRTVAPEVTYKKSDLENKPAEQKNKEMPTTQYQNLNAAFQIVEQRLAQIFSWDGRELKVNKIEGGTLDTPRIASTIDELFQKLIAHMQKMKAGNIESLKVTLKPEQLGELDLYFKMVDEQNSKKLFLTFAGEDKTLQILREKQQELTDRLQQQGYNLGGMEFLLYGSQDHQQQESTSDQEQQQTVLAENVLKSPDKEAIINTIDNYVADLIVNYIA
jgi:hypothetical protein